MVPRIFLADPMPSDLVERNPLQGFDIISLVQAEPLLFSALEIRDPNRKPRSANEYPVICPHSYREAHVSIAKLISYFINPKQKSNLNRDITCVLIFSRSAMIEVRKGRASSCSVFSLAAITPSSQFSSSRYSSFESEVKSSIVKCILAASVSAELIFTSGKLFVQLN